VKSIRLSLVLYFLLLLAGGVGAASYLVYQTTAWALQAKEDAARRLVLSQHGEEVTREERQYESARRRLRHQNEDYVREEKARLDEALLFQARTLAGMAQIQFQGSRTRYLSLSPLGALTAGVMPNGHLTVPFWVAEGMPGRLSWRLQRLGSSEIQFDEDDLGSISGGQLPEFYQVSLEWGTSWRSSSLGKRSLPFDPRQMAAIPMLGWTFDELEVLPGMNVRRVQVKAPATRFRFLGSWQARRPAGNSPRTDGPRPEGPPPPERVAESPPPPAILVQCAMATTQRDASLAALQATLQRSLDERQEQREARLATLTAERDQHLQRLGEESVATLGELRKQLLTISLATFVATVVGGYALVWLGLAPLRRLSEAVSRVSERDFRLQVEQASLPRELRPIAMRMSQTLELLQRAFAREKQAAADISHELRTPLAALLTTIEVALRKRRTSEEYVELLGDCRTLGLQMSQLVERLLALARLDAGVDTLRQEPVDVAVLAEQCAALVRPLAEARDLRLRVLAPGPVELTADPDKLREVITNLLHNAIEYNQPQGEVELTIDRQNGHLHVAVRDTGIGITPENRLHIFERFFRADPARQATGLHAGLGLAIVKGYVDLMGGTIQVDSAVGQGSTFRVELPASSQCGVRNAECGMDQG
jgi:signal transduction histidine kinase